MVPPRVITPKTHQAPLKHNTSLLLAKGSSRQKSLGNAAFKSILSAFYADKTIGIVYVVGVRDDVAIRRGRVVCDSPI
jgi:hypothetical protein